jgi:hypothetical protein
MMDKRLILRNVLVVVASLLFAANAFAQWNFPATAPATAKLERVESLRLPAGKHPATVVDLGLANRAEIDAVRRANAMPGIKALQIGIGRSVPAGAASESSRLGWQAVAGGVAAQWRVSSPGARALRVGLAIESLPAGGEIRLADAGGSGSVFGPFGAADIPAGERLWWSPVVEGDTAIVEIYAPGESVPVSGLAIVQVSHLFASPVDARIDEFAKIGESGTCEVDLICRSATDAALASVGKAVARMVFTLSGGGSALCTGTLLNPADGSFTPYFYSAAHCFSEQGIASTLATFWFYDATACRSGVPNPATVQLNGGATLLFANTATDVLFLRLNAAPPTGAVFAGWDAATLSPGTALTAVHHPAGDVKKVSLGDFAGFTAYGGGAGSSHIDVTWRSTATGVTEGGSSGSGVFSLGSGSYLLRGGLHGGPSSCSATGASLRDYYSRFDLAYPSLAAYLSPSSGGGTEAIVNGGFENGSTGWTESGPYPIVTTDAAFAHAGSRLAYLGGYGNATDVLYQDVAIPATATAATLRFWFRVGTEESGSTPRDTMTVTVRDPASGAVLTTLVVLSNANASTSWAQTPAFDLAAFRGQAVRIHFAAATDGSLDTHFFVDDVTLAVTAPTGVTLTVAASGSGSVTSSPAGINCPTTCSAAFASGTAVTLAATPGSGAMFAGWSGACSGMGACTVTLDTARSATATFAPAAAASRLANISTRGPVLAGSDVMIGGFVIGGATPKKVLLTARGPSLAAFGIADAIADPKLEVFSGSALVASNDNWQSGVAGDVAAIASTGTFPYGLAPSDAKEAALLLTLNPGAYTAIVSGADGGTGVGIVEVFEQDKPEIPLVNISTRGQVRAGTGVMIGGFIIQGSAPRTVLVTARGPSLATYGIANPLADPKLEIYSGSTLVASNDDWQTQAGGAGAVSAIQATGVAPGDAKESALLVTLNPGAYTAIVSGVGGVTGVAIVEVFAR